MRKYVYNLEFSYYCLEMNIFGYQFTRVNDYPEKISQLQHTGLIYSEFPIHSTIGEHVITAYVDPPEHEEKAALAWTSNNKTALDDILLLLSIFTGRDVLVIEQEDIQAHDPVKRADPRLSLYGGILRSSIPYKRLSENLDSCDIGSEDSIEQNSCNIGFEYGINRIYSLIRNSFWQDKYKGGGFLILAKQALRNQFLEAAFTQCWTIWEHLYKVLNPEDKSEKGIRDTYAREKIGYLLSEYISRDETTANQLIKPWIKARNELVHFGKFPEDDHVLEDEAIFFIDLTEFIIARILDLSPSNLFDTQQILDGSLSKKSARGELYRLSRRRYLSSS